MTSRGRHFMIAGAGGLVGGRLVAPSPADPALARRTGLRRAAQTIARFQETLAA